MERNMHLEYWEDECDAHMLKSAGIYAILDEEGNVLYIGETISFIRRWGEHCATGSSHKPVPTSEIYKFVVLAYEDNRLARMELEAKYRAEYKPPYNGRQMYPNKSKINPTKMREYRRWLRLNKLPEPQHKPYDLTEDCQEAIEEELRHLKTKIE